MRLYYGKDKVYNDSSQKISASGLQDPVELKPNEPLLKGFLLFSKTVVFGKKKKGGGLPTWIKTTTIIRWAII